MTDTVDVEVKKRHRISNISFAHEGAHIALVGPLVGGPANQQETVLWKSKSTDHITEADVTAVLNSKTTPENVELEKAKFNSEVRSALSRKVEDQFAGKYEWLYLEDFSDSQIVFSSDAGMFIVDYSLSGDDEYVLNDQAIGVEYQSILVENGQLKLSKDAQEKLNEGVYSLVTKALDNPETNERVKTAVTTILEKAKTMEVEIQKAVDAALAAQAEKLAGVEADLQKANEALAAHAEAAKQVVLKARTAEAAKFDAEGAEALVKATADLTDEAFATILKSLSVNSAVVEESDLMKQVSDPEAKGTAVENTTAALIKAAHAVK